LNSFIHSFTSIGSSMSSNGMPLSKIYGRVGATTIEVLAAPCSTGSCYCGCGLPITWLLHKQTCKQQSTRVKCRSTQPTYGIFSRLLYVRRLWFSDWHLPFTSTLVPVGEGTRAPSCGNGSTTSMAAGVASTTFCASEA
jgi:hypothetical protein